MMRQRGRALVIKRDAMAREIVCEYLTDLGFEVHGAADGAAGLARFEAGAYDLVVTDLAMPGITGREVVKAVRRRARHVPVILISGRLPDESVGMGGLGVTVVQQAFPLEDFRAAVNRALATGDATEESGRMTDMVSPDARLNSSRRLGDT